MSTIEKALGSLEKQAEARQDPPPRTVERAESSVTVSSPPRSSPGESNGNGAVAKKSRPCVAIPFDRVKPGILNT